MSATATSPTSSPTPPAASPSEPHAAADRRRAVDAADGAHLRDARSRDRATPSPTVAQGGAADVDRAVAAARAAFEEGAAGAR